MSRPTKAEKAEQLLLDEMWKRAFDKRTPPPVMFCLLAETQRLLDARIRRDDEKDQERAKVRMLTEKLEEAILRYTLATRHGVARTANRFPTHTDRTGSAIYRRIP
jgi:hypothetical protein